MHFSDRAVRRPSSQFLTTLEETLRQDKCRFLYWYVAICCIHLTLHVDEFADVQEANKGPFMDFEVKKDMRIAPLCRVLGLDVASMAERLDEHLASQVTDELRRILVHLSCNLVQEMCLS